MKLLFKEAVDAGVIAKGRIEIFINTVGFRSVVNDAASSLGICIEQVREKLQVVGTMHANCETQQTVTVSR